MWVIKLGGSLAANPELSDWCQILAGPCLQSDLRSVAVVPGGGPFADVVRIAQKTHGFDDETAHVMAIAGMEQYGRMLHGLVPALKPVFGLDDFALAAQEGRTAVWMPMAMTMATTMATMEESVDIPRNWETSSDSLAAWLAGRLKASRLVLIKSANPPALGPGGGPCGEGAKGLPLSLLQETGLIDRAFGNFVCDRGFDVFCIGPSGRSRLVAALGGDGDPGVLVDTTG